MRLWSYLHSTSPGGLAAFHFCINLIKTRVGVHSSLGPVFNVNMNHVVVRLILSDDSRSVSPDTSPPKVHHISRPVFPPEVLFFLFLKT